MLEFLFYEIGYWEGNKAKKWSELVFLSVAGKLLDLTGFDKTKNHKAEYLVKGTKEGIKWEKRAITDFNDNLGIWWVSNNSPDYKNGLRDQVRTEN